MRSTSEQAPWVIVAGGVNRLGGTDKANFALVEFLLNQGVTVHVVTHRMDPELASHPGVHVELVPVPGGWWLAGERLLSIKGRQVAHRVTAADLRARVVVNGGNCLWPDINWVHCVHHAWSRAKLPAPWLHQWKQRVAVAS